MRVIYGPAGIPYSLGGDSLTGVTKAAWMIAKNLVNLGVDLVYISPRGWKNRDFHGIKLYDLYDEICYLNPAVFVKWLSYIRLASKVGLNNQKEQRLGLIKNAIKGFALRKFLLKFPPDIFHTHGTSIYNFYFLETAFSLGKPIVITMHGLWRPEHERRLFRFIQSNNYRAKIVAVSSKVKRLIVEDYGVSPELVEVIPNGVEEDFFHPSAYSKEALRKHFGINGNIIILTVASLTQRKNHSLVIKSLGNLPKDVLRNITYLIVGKGPEEEKLKRLTKELNLESNVKFLGALKGQDLVNVYWASDFFILTSKNEGMPLVFLEAMAAGLPIITMRNLEGVEDIFEGHDNIWIPLHDYSPSSVAKGILTALTKKWDRESIRNIAKNFTWTKVAQKYLGIYKVLLGGNEE